MRLAELANVPPAPALLDTYRQLPDGPDDYRQLASLLIDRWSARDSRFVGIGGGQGAGKSTLGRLIAAAGEWRGLRVEVLSIDDFYLSQEARASLGRDVHPLLATRGPPGTHDLEALDRVVRALRRPGVVEVPRFDKGLDDRVAPVSVDGPVDLVVLEGWCVGAPPRGDDESDAPINALERDDDSLGRWRSFVDDALHHYQSTFAILDDQVFLAVPDLDAVRRWRLEQEGERAPEQRLSAAAVDRFVEHYERITRRMLRSMPDTAGVVVTLAADHSVAGLVLR